MHDKMFLAIPWFRETLKKKNPNKSSKRFNKWQSMTYFYKELISLLPGKINLHAHNTL